MKIDILLIWPNLKYNHWPAKGFELLADWLIKNWLNIKIVSWLNLSLLNFIYIFFTKKIYIISFPERILYSLVKIFKSKKFIIWADIPLTNINISSSIYSKKNVLKIFNTKEIMEYYLNTYNKKTWNCSLVHWHWIDIKIKNNNTKKYNFFVYYKNINKLSEDNTEKIYNKIIFFLNKNNINYNLIKYWDYKYLDWIKILKETKYWIFITSIEWYWIAKLESLNYNIPILNFEQKEGITIRWDILKNRSTFPIFEDWFWELFYNFENFEKKFNTIQNKKYNTKKIIKEKYCHIEKAKKLYKLFETF